MPANDAEKWSGRSTECKSEDLSSGPSAGDLGRDELAAEVLNEKSQTTECLAQFEQVGVRSSHLSMDPEILNQHMAIKLQRKTKRTPKIHFW